MDTWDESLGETDTVDVVIIKSWKFDYFWKKWND